MLEVFRCPNLEEHDSHEWVVNKEVTYEGRTECGAWSHPKHSYVVQAEEWCGGICKCGDNYKKVHGPGAHK